MSNEYIRKKDVLKGQKTGTFANGICFEAKACVPVDYIESLEPADVAPVVHGRWIPYRCDMYECSVCQRIHTSFDSEECDAYYCPHCGAKMDGKGEE